MDMGTGTADSGALGAREHGRGEADDIGNTEWWCRWCGQPVRLIGADGSPEQMRMAVHAATGDERGGLDGHAAAPQNYEPPLWRAARILTDEFGGAFDISARFGMLRADWAGGGCAEHFEAVGENAEEEMRARLRAAFISAGREPSAIPEPAGAGGGT
jgi:hypothetical protein